MSSISSPKSQPKQNVFDLSIRCSSDLPNIKKEISDKYLDTAHIVAQKHQHWSHSQVGRKIASIAYKEFEQKMKNLYSAPGYDYFLNCSIQQHYPYFYDDLAHLIEKKLKELHIPDE